MSKVEQIGITQFRHDFPDMEIISDDSSQIVLEGNFNFKATKKRYGEINDNYDLRLHIPKCFPRGFPKIEEIGNKIPRTGEFHVNGDGSLCLGSPIRILVIIYQHPSISGYVEECLIPYLFAVSYKLKNGGDFISGELDHGVAGLYDDYSYLLGLKNKDQIKRAIGMLRLEEGIANKEKCPCGCGKLLGECTFHDKLNKIRKMAAPSWFKEHSYL